MVAPFAIDTSNALSAAPSLHRKNNLTLIDANAHYGSPLVTMVFSRQSITIYSI